MEKQEILNMIAVLNTTLSAFSGSRFTNPEDGDVIVAKILDLVNKL